MAGFCTKCGAPLSDDTAFCTKCGAPVAATAAAPAPASYVPPASNAPAAYTPPQAAYVPPSQPPYAVAPPPKSGSSALKVILIIVAVFVGLGVLSAAMFGYFVYRASKIVHVSNNGNGSVELTTPAGTFSAGDTAVSASDLGIDLYPGSTQEKGAVRLSTPKGTSVTAVFDTTDSMDKVLDFYKDKLGSGASVYQSDKSAVLTLADEAKKASVMVTISADNDGKTKIAVIHSVGT